MAPLAIGGVVTVLALSVLAFMVWKAPRGWRDDDGFHEGDEHAREENLGI